MAQVKAEFEMEGIEWPQESMGEYLRRVGPVHGEVDPDDPHRMTRILEEVREDTV